METITIANKKDVTDGWLFTVDVSDDSGTTNHMVTVDEDYYKKLAKKDETPEQLVERSFEFLLDRESKNSILATFNLKDIATYFPEYEKENEAA